MSWTQRGDINHMGDRTVPSLLMTHSWCGYGSDYDLLFGARHKISGRR